MKGENYPITFYIKHIFYKRDFSGYTQTVLHIPNQSEFSETFSNTSNNCVLIRALYIWINGYNVYVIPIIHVMIKRLNFSEII